VPSEVLTICGRISELEEKLGAGLIEEVIQVAQGEEQLVKTMIENQVYVLSYRYGSFASKLIKKIQLGGSRRDTTRRPVDISRAHASSSNIDAKAVIVVYPRSICIYRHGNQSVAPAII
jgi:hypothetical protein